MMLTGRRATGAGVIRAAIEATASRLDGPRSAARGTQSDRSLCSSVVRIGRHAGWQMLESTVIPSAIFYLGRSDGSLRWGLAAALLWCLVAVAARSITSRRLPGVLVLSTVLFIERTIVSWATGSEFLYLLQPILGSALVAAALVLSASASEPLIERVARDFLDLPAGATGGTGLRRFFVGLSLIWGLVYFLKAASGLWLLLISSLGKFLILSNACSWAMTAVAITVSALWFGRSVAPGVVMAPPSPATCRP
jgi:hypothetical protein